MIDAELLKILCCPETHQPLKLADSALVQKVNELIKAGQLQTRAGKPITQPCDGGLVRQDGQFLYPIRQNIPILLINEAIPLVGQASSLSH
jgi:uncharacterized protein YbaR (Trm112 family)